MIPYVVEDGYFRLEHLEILEKALDLVRTCPTKDLEGRWVRCHELARAVAHYLEQFGACGLVACECVVDGLVTSVQHTWIRLPHGVILDVYAPGRLPQCQLVHAGWPVGTIYLPGPEREDVRWDVMDWLLATMEAASLPGGGGPTPDAPAEVTRGARG